MQTLFIPEKIEIQLVDALGKPITQDKILIGIRTFANRKNSVDLSPFLSDEDGVIKITADDIKERFDVFVSYGLMDYVSLESAKPLIEFYYWGNTHLNQYIQYWTSIFINKKDNKKYEMWDEQLGKLQKEFAIIEKREREELKIFETCFNRKIKQAEDVTLIQDTWDRANTELKYNAKITFHLQ